MTLRWGTIGLLALLAAGCQEPTQMVPVGPPGVEFSRVPPVPEGEGAQALGEAAVQSASQPTTATPVASNIPLAESTAVGQANTLPSGLSYETLAEGTGEPVKSGQTAVVHYTGTLTDGQKFDSSRDRNQPFPVRLGTGSVIQGWEQGIPGMKVGERRKLTIPSDLAYGDQGQPPVIPPKATLIFDVELIEIK